MKKEYLSVKDLRDYLDEFESRWSERDDKILGKFENQAVLVDVYEYDGDIKKFLYKGLGHSRISYDGTLGFIIEPSNVEEMWADKSNN